MIPPNRVSFEDDNSDSANEGVVETFPRSSVKVQDTSHAVFPSPEPILKPLKSFTTLDLPDVSHFMFSACFLHGVSCTKLLILIKMTRFHENKSMIIDNQDNRREEEYHEI